MRQALASHAEIFRVIRMEDQHQCGKPRRSDAVRKIGRAIVKVSVLVDAKQSRTVLLNRDQIVEFKLREVGSEPKLVDRLMYDSFRGSELVDTADKFLNPLAGPCQNLI